MPVRELPPAPDDETPTAGRQACQRYVTWVRDLLEALIYEEEYAEQFDRDSRELARRAWGDVLLQFEKAIGRFDDCPDEPFVEHGLYGAQLAFKWHVVQRWLSRWLQRLANLRHLLKVVDDLLDSILAAIGASGAIMEFKKAVEESTLD